MKGRQMKASECEAGTLLWDVELDGYYYGESDTEDVSEMIAEDVLTRYVVIDTQKKGLRVVRVEGSVTSEDGSVWTSFADCEGYASTPRDAMLLRAKECELEAKHYEALAKALYGLAEDA